MTVAEKVAYLKGLADGLGLDGEASKQDKMILAIVDALEDVAASLHDLEENALDLGEEIDALSDDLADVESIVYDEDEEEEDECDCCDHDAQFSATCPECGEEFTFSESDLDGGELNCPNCGHDFLEDIPEDGGCCCGDCAEE